MSGNNDDDTNMEHSSADGQRDSVDAKADKQDNADILVAICLMKADLSVQLQEVVLSNPTIKEAINVFSERLTAVESRIGKTEDNISALTGKD